MSNLEPIAVTPNQAFALIGVGVTKGYELINGGEFETFKIGRATRITTASVRAFVARQLEQRQGGNSHD
jgi:predicted DNA-binding transcriptional regulator AlpA